MHVQLAAGMVMFTFVVYGLNVDRAGNVCESVVMTADSVGDPSRVASALANAAGPLQSGLAQDVPRVVAWRPFRGWQGA